MWVSKFINKDKTKVALFEISDYLFSQIIENNGAAWTRNNLQFKSISRSGLICHLIEAGWEHAGVDDNNWTMYAKNC